MTQAQDLEVLALLREIAQLQREILERLKMPAPQRVVQEWRDWNAPSNG
jgi:hypothetical protein